MSRVLLLPRLTALGVTSILEAANKNSLTSVGSRAVLDANSAMLSFAASGGSRSEQFAAELGAGLREIAATSGFPDNPSQVARSKFDQEAAAYLGGHEGLATGEALRDDVWAYLATVIVPDIVAWRFPDRAAHRFEGGVRNALQRLWMRGFVLDRGQAHADRWALVRGLSEDAAVQIFERASIGGSQSIARALAEVWIQTAARVGRGPMEEAMRRAIKLVRLRNEIIDLASLPPDELQQFISDVFSQLLPTPSPA